MRFARLVAATAAALTLSVTTATFATARTIPVRFSVENVNRSLLPCPADGARYELQGWLVTPPGGPGSSVTVYLHEFSFGSRFWRFPDERYDYAEALARQGATSVVIDRLGYGDSPTPAGTATCLGAQADMASQVVQQLRTRGFKRVALGGHSAGAAVAELAYHSFGGVDALALFGWAHTGYTPDVLQESFLQGGVCSRGGEPKRPGGAPGYAFFSQTEERFRHFAFADAEPSVADRMTATRERDPCGDVATLTPAVAADASRADQVQVPVLLVMGDADPVYDPGTGEQQAKASPNSPSVELVKVPHAAHAVTLERAAPAMREQVARWLRAHGLAEAPAPTAVTPKTKPRHKRARHRSAKRCAKKSKKHRHGHRTARKNPCKKQESAW